MCNETDVSIFKINKIKIKKNYSSHRYDTNRPRPRYGYKHTNNIKSGSVCCLLILSNT